MPPVRPCEAVCAPFPARSGEVPAPGEIATVEARMAQSGGKLRATGSAPVHRDGEEPTFGWGQHRVCLDMGQSPSPANRILRAEARTHFQNGGQMKKDTTFSIRISSEDLATIRQKAKDARLSQSEYVTRCCLGRQIVIMDGLKEVLQQQRAIGNNLNRLTVLANMGRVTAVDLERTAQELATISSTLRDIQERARRSG